MSTTQNNEIGCQRLALKTTAARIAKVCNRTLDAMEERGEIRPIRSIEGVKIYRVDELERLAAARAKRAR